MLRKQDTKQAGTLLRIVGSVHTPGSGMRCRAVVFPTSSAEIIMQNSPI